MFIDLSFLLVASLLFIISIGLTGALKSHTKALEKNTESTGEVVEEIEETESMVSKEGEILLKIDEGYKKISSDEESLLSLFRSYSSPLYVVLEIDKDLSYGKLYPIKLTFKSIKEELKDFYLLERVRK